MPRLIIAKIERLRSGADDGRRTMRYFIRPGSRSRAWKFFDVGQVPGFEGESAWFEIDRAKGGWTFLREVPSPGGLA